MFEIYILNLFRLFHSYYDKSFYVKDFIINFYRIYDLRSIFKRISKHKFGFDCTF